MEKKNDIYRNIGDQIGVADYAYQLWVNFTNSFVKFSN